MAKNTSRISRFRIGTHVVIQIVAMAIVVLGVNYLGFHYYVRGDFSRSQKFSLSDQTKRVMKQLEKPATIIVYFSPTSLTPDSALYPDVNALLRELQFSAKKNLTVEFVNPTRNFARARDLQNQYKFGANENVVIVDYDGRSKFLPVSQMAVWQENVLMGDTPQVKEFKGEQVLTTAFLELIKPETRKIYFLQGHGEPTFAPTPPLSILRDYIIRQGLTAEPLNLAALDAVPEDAGALVIISPQSDPAQREMEIIKAFWEKNGAVYVALEPGMDTPLIQAFLVEKKVKGVFIKECSKQCGYTSE